MTIEIADLSHIQPYNEDVRVAGYPPPVAAFRDAIRAADALLIATPEYNYSVSGVLKNAIDWASRPPDQPLAGKPLAIMGASGGLGGTMRAQYHLRQICVFVDLLPLNKPEVMVRSAADKFDANGNLTDEETRARVRKLLDALQAWTMRLRSR
jgi:chromate reductase